MGGTREVVGRGMDAEGRGSGVGSDAADAWAGPGPCPAPPPPHCTGGGAAAGPLCPRSGHRAAPSADPFITRCVLRSRSPSATAPIPRTMRPSTDEAVGKEGADAAAATAPSSSSSSSGAAALGATGLLGSTEWGRVKVIGGGWDGEYVGWPEYDDSDSVEGRWWLWLWLWLWLCAAPRRRVHVAQECGTATDGLPRGGVRYGPSANAAPPSSPDDDVSPAADAVKEVRRTKKANVSASTEGRREPREVWGTVGGGGGRRGGGENAAPPGPDRRISRP
jgi:hypothetical protein